MIFIVGGKGLTGSAIVRYLEKNAIKYKIITKENKEEFINKQCDTLIYANGNAKKYLANQDPFFDYNASISSVAFYIHNIKYTKFIHLSTIDIYPNCSNLEFTKEELLIDANKQSIYGFHKYLAEQYIRKFAKNYLIFRLPALVGKGLQKNPIYDFINPNKKVLINSNSSLNVINTDFVASSIFKLIDRNIKNETFNLASKNSIQLKNIEKLINLQSQYAEDASQHIQNYQINCDKISKYINLTRSEDAILSYFNMLRRGNE